MDGFTAKPILDDLETDQEKNIYILKKAKKCKQ